MTTFISSWQSHHPTTQLEREISEQISPALPNYARSALLEAFVIKVELINYAPRARQTLTMGIRRVH